MSKAAKDYYKGLRILVQRRQHKGSGALVTKQQTENKRQHVAWGEVSMDTKAVLMVNAAGLGH